jgi:transposase
MKSGSNILIKFARACVAVCRHSRMPLFSNKYSKKLYKQYQHACVILLMKKERKHYRTVIQLLEIAPGLVHAIGLKRLPHYTTLQKFFRRLGTPLLERILSQTARLFELSGVVAIDSTGFSSNYASRYFMMIKYRARKGVWKDSYMKNSVVVDVGEQAVVASRPRMGKGHDTLDFMPLLRKASATARIRTVIADKGYDSEANHRFVREVLGAGTVIPVRRSRGGVSGMFRMEMASHFDIETYRKRQVVETVFFVMKRMFGDTIYSRSLRQQKKELKVVCITYNLYRHAILFYQLEVFYSRV